MRNCYHFIIAFLTCSFLLFSACGTSSAENEVVDDGIQITMPYNDNYYTGSDWPVEIVVSEFEKLGFTNMTTIEEEQGMFYFSVESVEIFTNDSDKKGDFDEGDTFSSNDIVEIHYYGNHMEDGLINYTNAQIIEDSLKSNSNYNFWDDHSLTQSNINGDWSVSNRNNDYNTYTKSYDISAHKFLIVELASFATYDNDIDYLLYCASFFDTPYIDVDELQQWIKDFDTKDGYVTKVFGDTEFTLSYGWDNSPNKLELHVAALD